MWVSFDVILKECGGNHARARNVAYRVGSWCKNGECVYKAEEVRRELDEDDRRVLSDVYQNHTSPTGVSGLFCNRGVDDDALDRHLADNEGYTRHGAPRAVRMAEPAEDEINNRYTTPRDKCACGDPLPQGTACPVCGHRSLPAEVERIGKNLIRRLHYAARGRIY
jgi:hypothetical protein